MLTDISYLAVLTCSKTLIYAPLLSFGSGSCAYENQTSESDEFIWIASKSTDTSTVQSQVLNALLGTILYLVGFAGVSILIAIGLVAMGKTGVFWAIHKVQNGLPGRENQDKIDGSKPVMSIPDLPVADPSNNSDIQGSRLENPLPLPFTKSVFGRFIVDEKDLPLLEMLVTACFIVVPMAVLCYALFIYAPFGIAALYGFGVYQWVRVRYFMHGLLHFRHFSSHRPLFQSKVANILPNLFLDPLMGIPPLVFRLHHTIMHHVANNGKYDISSTEPYQRDDWVAFAQYWFRFQVQAYYELPLYAWKTGRRSWCIASVTVIGSFLVGLRWLADASSAWATFCVFGLPWLMDHASDGVRNWCQHMFVLPLDSPHVGVSKFHHNCGLTYNIIDCEHNRRTYNEGYHVIHHSGAGQHWSTMPSKYYEEVEGLKSSPEDVWCLSFVDTTIWEVFLHTATQGKLESFVQEHFVHIPTAARPNPPTVDEVVCELRGRCTPIDQDIRAKATERFARK